ncbi:MEDS domain-containing protein [Evansella sp. LMS18]|jgi:hypothetical protein|uniref:MEDS domain-containing protein n=1 Tax=Evansella sp. LMS18 TaxID=2924033 RepID=UPI0020D121E5|nr:MEDS domain-containing protein [Evansella sp. LMS18]UTR12789.1 MEDS domain-containing protein [Evansella sp. LMS18]
MPGVEWKKDFPVTEGHILYTFNSDDIYLENAVNYIISGIREGEHVLVVESSRNIPKLREKLMSQLNEKEQKKIHYTNNFTFYMLNRSFQAETVLHYFSKVVTELSRKAEKLRIWAHVEWGDKSSFIEEIAKYERGSDKVIQEEELLCVCAYREKNVCPELKKILLQHHSIELRDNKLYISRFYPHSHGILSALNNIIKK